MTKHEAVVISAYTGVSLIKFSYVHEYIEKILGRPVWTHELASEAVMQEIKKASREDFLKICEGVKDV